MAGKRVVVAMSGGVDSSVTALLLKRQGFEPIGLFLRNGVEAPQPASKSCCSVYDARDARVVAAELGIPFHSLDFSGEFQDLIGYFVEEYRQGRTPNPCAMCNRDLKFGKLFEITRELGAEYLATGHYARVEHGPDGPVLRRAADRTKDQSYQLFPIKKDTLERVLFPLGAMQKTEVREIAAEAGLPTSSKAESQEICFVPTNDYRDLLRERDIASPSGNLTDTGGEVLATHDGVAQFTIGQRRGLGIARGKPQYVVEIDSPTGRVVIGSREECMFRGGVATRLNWLGDVLRPGQQIEVDIQIRYRHPGRPGTVELDNAGRAHFEFREPEHALTPGQAAVFYQEDRVLGGGWIEQVTREA